MERREFVRGGLAATLLAAGASARPVAAQTHEEPSGFLCVTRLPCCSCTRNDSPRIAIHTGSVPWRVTTPSSPYPVAATPVSPLPSTLPGWASEPPAIWVGPPGAGINSPAGNYTYELEFYVPNCVIPSTITLSGEMAADNSARVYLDSNPAVIHARPQPAYYVPGTLFSTAPITGAGVHKLRVVVNNLGGYTGLLFRGFITVACPPITETGEAAPSP
jgi:hypothetical protein